MIQNVLQFLPAERRSQKDDILDYLFRHGSLTRMEAFTELGVCELSSRIGELEKDGWHIPRGTKRGRAANGRKWIVTEYLRPERVL